MVWQRIRIGLLTAGLVAAAALTVRAESMPRADEPAAGAPPAAHAHPAPAHPAPAHAAPAHDPCAPATRKVLVTEYVCVPTQETRTAYRTEFRTETYTAHRTECVPEQRTRTVTVNKLVPVVETRTRTVCVNVPVVEERTVVQTRVSCRPVTTTVCKTVDKGHYECKEVPCGPSLKDRLKKLFKKKCCDPCGCPEECEPVRTKTVKVWVPCLVTEHVPVTRMEKFCEQVPTTVRVTVNKVEQRQETFQVTVNKCVAEQRTETFTVNVARQVAFQATRQVPVCVPFQQTVTVNKLVARTVEKEVPAEACPTTSCCETVKCCKRGLFGLFGK